DETTPDLRRSCPMPFSLLHQDKNERDFDQPIVSVSLEFRRAFWFVDLNRADQSIAWDSHTAKLLQPKPTADASSEPMRRVSSVRAFPAIVMGLSSYDSLFRACLKRGSDHFLCNYPCSDRSR
ncbi:MAG: hypothetical protein ABI945_02105, partial [Nitrospirales bacterium]